MKSHNIQLDRLNIKKLMPYQSARRIRGKYGEIFLDANECPIPVLFELKNKSFNRYPECQPYELISTYAKYANVFFEQVLVTRGADEGIELLIKAFCEPKNDAIIYCPPTYDMYRVNSEIADVKIKEIPTIKDTWQLDLLSIQLNLDNVKLVYICNPNNPTGSTISQNDLINLLNMTINKSLVVIDEAYIEFFPEISMSFFLKTHPNLVILRTLSKAFALAGIRCGFVLAQKEIIDTLKKVIGPYPISAPAADIATQALQIDHINFMKNRVLHLTSNRIWLSDQLKHISCVKKVFNSHANYILVQFFSCVKIFKSLWKDGIILRNQSNKTHLHECIRITIGARSECRKLVQELKKLC
ncbi:MAG: histidinol-phosphate transaminase [Buchnera aphidicola (Pentalonia nigronervosa)]|jgi:histidinol-phosphate aminotransferase|uniref:Histidinol-phosphate aminotransferase n=1 Tax=Buchnera aphidicola (Pentalonia nigronervosa) TaxID=1309793 RepID=A0A7H1AZD7_9GAMM|nr:MAG: histidinol-phosphate transaminase [Buchnera aphidicola (Pentalonia nigronervosa)]